LSLSFFPTILSFNPSMNARISAWAGDRSKAARCAFERIRFVGTMYPVEVVVAGAAGVLADGAGADAAGTVDVAVSVSTGAAVVAGSGVLSFVMFG